jgi:hypothetical protein
MHGTGFQRQDEVVPKRIPMSQAGRSKYVRRQATMRKAMKGLVIALFLLTVALLGAAIYVGYR